MAKKTAMLCPDCGTILSIEKGTLWGWKATTCPRCNRTVHPKEERISYVHCERCNRDVEVDLLGTDRIVCPGCHSSLTLPVQKAQERDVTCPHCRMDMKASDDPDNGKIQCPHCDKLFTVDEGIRAYAEKDTETVMRITNEGRMDPDKILWRHPASGFSARSTIELAPGTVALLIDGEQCVGIAQSSGETIMSIVAQNGGTGRATSVVFVRRQLRRKLLCGVGSLCVHDAQHQIKPDSKIGTFGKIYVRIDDVETFARKVGFQSCTETDIGLRDEGIDENPLINKAFPQVKIEMQRYLNAACSAVLQRNHCFILQLSHYKDDIETEFRRLAEEELKREWGMAVIGCELGGMRIENDHLVVCNPAVISATKRLNWGPITVNVHRKDNAEYRASIDLSGTVQMRVNDQLRLESSLDWAQWSIETEKACRDIVNHINENLNGLLTSMVQGKINVADADIRELPNYCFGIQNQIRERFAPDEANGYLYAHGLAIETLTVNIGEPRLNDALAQYYALQKNRATVGLQVENAQLEGRTKVELSRVQANTDVQIQLDVNDAQERLKQQQHEAQLRERQRKNELWEQESQITHNQNMAEMSRKEREQELFDRNRMESARRDSEYTKYTDAMEREREINAQRHEELMTEVMISIEKSKLSFQEKLDAYARMKQLQDTLNVAEVQRGESQGKTDAQRIAKLGELQVSKAAQDLIEEAAKAEQTREENKKNAQLERDMKLRREALEAELEKFRLQEEIRRAERESEERLNEARMEVEKLRITLSCYEAELKREADVAHAEAAAERARRDAEREYNRRKHEEQEKRNRENRERNERQRTQQDKDRKHLEKMLEELTRLQAEIAQGMKPQRNEPSDTLERMNELTRAVQEMLGKLNGSSNPGQGTNPHQHRAGGYVQDNNRQPGMRGVRRCICCNMPLEDNARFCPSCGMEVN